MITDSPPTGLLSRRIAAGLEALDVAVAPATAEALACYLTLLADWNRTYNLTGINDPDAMVSRHIIDSAAALPFLHGELMLDMGSGAGLPGLVLALLAPASRWLLVESNGKKARFLAHAVRALGLTERVLVHGGRVEWYRAAEGFDTITARALADMKQLLAWGAPLLAPGGRLVALKGRRVSAEAELGTLPAGWCSRVNPVTLPGLGAERCIVVVERGPP